MKIILFVFAFSFFATVSLAQTVSMNDLSKMTGNWTGQLTYLDYTSNKSESVKAALAVQTQTDQSIELTYFYPNESSHGGKEIFILRAKGTMINEMKVIKRTADADGTIRLELEEKGKDGNDEKAATFHHVIVIEKNKLTMTKLVKFDEAKNFFQRNQYVFNR